MTRRNAWTVVLAVCALTAALCLLTTPPAKAAQSRPEPPPPGQSFAWTFEGTCCVNSRSWKTTKKADIVITSTVLPCEEGQEYRILLERKKRFGWTKSGNWRYHHCSGTATWEDRKVSRYRFRLEVAETVDDPVREGFGTVYYDGAG